jgi:hypothetical protein
VCGNIQRAHETQHETLGDISGNLVGTEAARCQRLASFEGAIFKEFKAQGIKRFSKQTLIFILYWHSKTKSYT